MQIYTLIGAPRMNEACAANKHNWDEICGYCLDCGMTYGEYLALWQNEHFGVKCECGSKFDKDFPDQHMFYCPKWKKEEDK